jgi:hypothetical protein
MILIVFININNLLANCLIKDNRINVDYTIEKVTIRNKNYLSICIKYKI